MPCYRYFLQKISPEPVKNPKLIKFNKSLSKELNIDPKKSMKKMVVFFFLEMFFLKVPNLLRWHTQDIQFGNFVPQLGDGRAVLLGELIAKNGDRYDVQLKGSGKTIFSRNGDGRSPLGPVIREYLLSESLHYLGIKSTRSLAIVATGEDVFRETKLPGEVLTRIASSHVRIGTFEFLFKNDIKSLKILADYTIKRHFRKISKKTPYKSLLKEVIKSQADLIAKWIGIGLLHTLAMNTDNTAICGETIDFGPCAFMDYYNPRQVYSFIDEGGRYSYINQGK